MFFLGGGGGSLHALYLLFFDQRCEEGWKPESRFPAVFVHPGHSVADQLVQNLSASHFVPAQCSPIRNSMSLKGSLLNLQWDTHFKALTEVKA